MVTRNRFIIDSDKVYSIVQRIHKLGGRACLVGGSVRDKVLGLNPKDADIEVFGINPELLKTILSEFGIVKAVGKSYGIYITTIDEVDYDFSIPRRENKVGVGHKDFAVTTDINMTVEEAALRRDFTFNAMSIDLATNNFIDPYKGKNDLELKLLVPVSEKFAEDPLRVLRGMQFAGRMELDTTKSFNHLSISLMNEFQHLARERVWSEWEKWALKSVKPSKGLNLLVDCGWIDLFPELNNMRNCPQDPVWHPEGDCFIHSCHVVDEMSILLQEHKQVINNLPNPKEFKLVCMLGAICHDLGKVGTTKFIDGKWKAPKHASNLAPSESFLDRIGCPPTIKEKVLILVKQHMWGIDFDDEGTAMDKNSIKRLIRRKLSTEQGVQLVSVLQLVLVMEADRNGRPPLPKGRITRLQKMLDLAEEIKTEPEALQPIITGDFLITLGMKQGKELGMLKNECYNMQLDGSSEEELKLHVSKILNG